MGRHQGCCSTPHSTQDNTLTTKNYLAQKANSATDIENGFVVAKGGRGGMDWEFGVSRCKLLHTEWINNTVLLCSTGNYIQYPGINHNGKEYKKQYIYMCISESLCCTAEINTTL